MGRSLFVATVAAVHLSLASAQVGPPQTSEVERVAVASVLSWLQTILRSPADLSLDPSLRESLTALTDEHLARMAPMVRNWASQDMRSIGDRDGGAARLRTRLFARMLNEVAMWRVESPGAAYDELFLDAILKPGRCRANSKIRPYYPAQTAWLQGLSPANRAVALAGERELFARWGRARQLPSQPVKSLNESEDAVLARIRQEEAWSGPALPPMLAQHLLVKTSSEADLSCTLHRWGLAQAVEQEPARKSEALNAYRYAMMPTATYWYPDPEPGDEAGRGYPRFASEFGVEGEVTLHVTLDAEGGFRRAKIVRREISVPGISGRPLAFERVLDKASLARAASERYERPDPGAVRQGTATASKTIRWQLRD